MTDTAEELRIIAKDSHGLSKADRETLSLAANEMDVIQQRLAAVSLALDESQGHRIAMDERYRELKRERPLVNYRLLPVTNVHWHFQR